MWAAKFEIYKYSQLWERILYIDATRSSGTFFSLAEIRRDDNGIDVSRNLQDLETECLCAGLFFLVRAKINQKRLFYATWISRGLSRYSVASQSRLSSRHCRKRRCTSGEPTIKSASGCEFQLDTRWK